MTIGSSYLGSGEVLAQLRDMQSQMRKLSDKAANQKEGGSGPSFMEHLKEGLSDINKVNKTADTMATDLASGKSQNIHETMLAATQAELSFNLMVQVRNKVLEAYQEVMRLQV